MDVGGPSGGGGGAGSSAPPPPRLPLSFSMGEPTQNLNSFRKACRSISRSQIGLSVSSFDDVPDSVRKDMFRSLQRDFELEDDHYSYVMQLMASQLKTWRSSIRKRYIPKDMSAGDIRRLKENNPLKGISLSHWESFIDREASDEKLSEREQARQNRAHYVDPHRLGTHSYNEFEQHLRTTGVEADRSSRYMLARSGKKGAPLRPSSADVARRIEAQRENVDEIDRSQVDRDALARVLGKDGHGRVRGVSSKISKSKYKGFFGSGSKKQSSSSTDEFVEAVNRQFAPKFQDIQSRLESLERASASGSSSGTSVGTGQFSLSIPLSSPPSGCFTRQARPSPTPDDSTQLYTMYSPFTYTPIAYGRSSAASFEGVIVNGEACTAHECRVYVNTILDGCEGERLYRSFGGVETIGAALGHAVIWPRGLLHSIDA